MAPRQKPGRSEQVVQTPADFMAAVRGRFGVPDLDVAALPSNAQAPRFYTPEDDGLAQPWDGDLNWCNPPYDSLAAWTRKAVDEMRAGYRRSLLLVPASVGSNWWRDFVHRKAHVFLLNGRLTFVGHTSPYPKDLSLLYYDGVGFDLEVPPSYEVWDWRRDIVT